MWHVTCTLVITTCTRIGTSLAHAEGLLQCAATSAHVYAAIRSEVVLPAVQSKQCTHYTTLSYPLQLLYACFPAGWLCCFRFPAAYVLRRDAAGALLELAVPKRNIQLLMAGVLQQSTEVLLTDTLARCGDHATQVCGVGTGHMASIAHLSQAPAI